MRVVEPQRVLEKTVGWGNAWRHKQKLSDIWEGSSGFCVTEFISLFLVGRFCEATSEVLSCLRETRILENRGERETGLVGDGRGIIQRPSS